MTKTAYLTIDDAPSPVFEDKLELLISNDVPAVFFCEGHYLEERPEIVVKAIREGFIIGNHAYSHPKFSDISLEKAEEEIRRTDELIDKLYERAGVDRPGKFFRFPFGNRGGEKEEELQSFLREQGYSKPGFPGITYGWYDEKCRDKVDWFWTFDVKEYEIDSREEVLERMDEDEPGNMKGLNTDSADIILIHDHKETHEVFKSAIRRLMEKVEFRKPV